MCVLAWTVYDVRKIPRNYVEEHDNTDDGLLQGVLKLHIFLLLIYVHLFILKTTVQYIQIIHNICCNSAVQKYLCDVVIPNGQKYNCS
jgi:hypothetical protein